MSEGHSDIRTIRNIAIFFLVMFIIGMVLSIGSGVYIYYQAYKAAHEDDDYTPPPPSTSMKSAALHTGA